MKKCVLPNLISETCKWQITTLLDECQTQSSKVWPCNAIGSSSSRRFPLTTYGCVLNLVSSPRVRMNLVKGGCLLKSHIKVVVKIVYMLLFSWQGQNLSWFSLAFIIERRGLFQADNSLWSLGEKWRKYMMVHLNVNSDVLPSSIMSKSGIVLLKIGYSRL